MRIAFLISFIIISSVSSFAQKQSDIISKYGYFLNDSTINLEQYPIFPGGKKKLRLFTHKDLYNSELYQEFIDTHTQGYIFVSYTIDTTRSIKNLNIDKRSLYFDSKKVSDAKRVELTEQIDIFLKNLFAMMPKWNPAIQMGKKIPLIIKSPIIVNLL